MPEQPSQKNGDKSEKQLDSSVRLARLEWELESLQKGQSELKQVAARFRTAKIWAIAVVAVLFAAFGLSWRDINSNIKEAYEGAAIKKIEDESRQRLEDIRTELATLQSLNMEAKEAQTRILKDLESISVSDQLSALGTRIDGQTRILKDLESIGVSDQLSALGTQIDGIRILFFDFSASCKWEEGTYEQRFSVPICDDRLVSFWLLRSSYPTYWVTNLRYTREGTTIILSWEEKDLKPEFASSKEVQEEDRQANTPITVTLALLVVPRSLHKTTSLGPPPGAR